MQPGCDALVCSLESYQKRFPEEAATVSRFITFVLRHPDCFERGLKIGHVTGSAWLVNRAGTHVLLTHHRKLNQWFQLGGHSDGDPDVFAVAAREAREESGLPDVVAVSDRIFDVDIHLIPARKDDPEHFHYDIRYAFRAEGSETFVISGESHDLAWIPIERLEEKTREPSMLRMASKWIRGGFGQLI